MTMLCFLLDLRTIAPPLLRDLRQSLLKLANLYAISSGGGVRGEGSGEARPLRDRMGLCYIRRDRASLSEELKIAYCPRENFNLRDFHHAINNLPTDYFWPEVDIYDSGDSVKDLSKFLGDESPYPWTGEDVLKKLVFVSSSLITNIESLRKTLMDAAERCISVEFLLLEQDYCHDSSDKLKPFLNSISDLENCVLRRYVPETSVLCGLVKRWLQELNNDSQEALQVVFVFKENIICFKNRVQCSLYPSFNRIVDGFLPCQTCRCHGQSIVSGLSVNSKINSCAVTKQHLDTLDLLENAVKVGEHIILFLPSFHDCQNIQRASVPIIFTVVERINLATLDEGLMFGASHVAIPSSCHEIDKSSDDTGPSDLNTTFFYGLRDALTYLDQGLLCSSKCNIETMKDVSFQCFYALQPSHAGPMLLRRVAVGEEILPIPEAVMSNDSSVPKDMMSSILASVSKIKLGDYDPLQHQRGFHLKLNSLVKESLQFGALPPKHFNTNDNHHGVANCKVSVLSQSLPTQDRETEMQPSRERFHDEMSSIAEEWEQLLIVDEVKGHLTTSMSIPELENINSPLDGKAIDKQTSTILERLEPPKQKSARMSPVTIGGITDRIMKKPLLPFSSTTSLSQPLKPSFQRPKRKLQ